MAGNRSRFSKHQMTGSPVFSINLTYLRVLTNPNYLMSIKKSQAILKWFIELKSSVWFTLGSQNETMFMTLKKLFSGVLPVNVFKTINDRQSYIVNKFDKSKKSI